MSALRLPLINAHADGHGSWIEDEVLGCEIRGLRLGKHIETVLKQLSEVTCKSIPLVCQDWANAKAVYRFFDLTQWTLVFAAAEIESVQRNVRRATDTLFPLAESQPQESEGLFRRLEGHGHHPTLPKALFGQLISSVRFVADIF